MNDLLDKLSGYKTYIAAVGFAIVAYYYWQAGDHVTAGQMAMTALSLIGLRHAISKAPGAEPEPAEPDKLAVEPAKPAEPPKPA